MENTIQQTEVVELLKIVKKMKGVEIHEQVDEIGISDFECNYIPLSKPFSEYFYKLVISACQSDQRITKKLILQWIANAPSRVNKINYILQLA